MSDCDISQAANLPTQDDLFYYYLKSKSNEICAELTARKLPEINRDQHYMNSEYNSAIDDACRVVREKLGE